MKRFLYFDTKYLISELKPMFGLKYLREDIFAGITVACIAIPLSLAIAMASSVSPGVGLISAIIGGIIAACFGGTRLAVTGPAAAMAILIANCVETYGLAGLLVIGLICGILQIAFGLFRLGRFARLVPLPVIAAFTAGIGFIIFVGQLPKALQLPTPDQNHVFYVIQHISHYITSMNRMAFVLAIITIFILRILPKYVPLAPTPLIAVAIPTAIVFFFDLPDIQLVGTIPHSLPMPSMPDFSGIKDWHSLIISALEVFALASLETLLSSSATDNLGKGDLHNPNQELIGQGLANAGVALFGGIPVTGVIARSSVIVAAGAVTRRSPIIHSLVILSVVYLSPNLVEMIPIAALAAILLSAAISMMNLEALVDFWKSNKSEAIIYMVTFCMIIATDLIKGVQAGIIVAFLMVGLRMLATESNIKLWASKQVLRVSLTGGMTFWSFEKLNKIQNYIATCAKLRFIIFELDQLQGMDTTGARHLVNAAKEIAARGIKVIFHKPSGDQQKLIVSTTDNKPTYVFTNTENAVQHYLEQAGIQNTVHDILKHSMQNFLGEHAKENQQLLTSIEASNKPHTLLITCSDIRLNPHAFFSVGLGELFVIRNLGNIIPEFSRNSPHAETATIEFAINDLGIRNVVICAHTECSAINACMYNNLHNHSNLNSYLETIKHGFSENYPLTIDDGVKFNLLQQFNHLIQYPMIAKLLNKKQIQVSAWIYDANATHLLEWNTETRKFIQMHEG
jgi:carbonic anhydrase